MHKVSVGVLIIYFLHLHNRPVCLFHPDFDPQDFNAMETIVQFIHFTDDVISTLLQVPTNYHVIISGNYWLLLVPILLLLLTHSHGPTQASSWMLRLFCLRSRIVQVMSSCSILHAPSTLWYNRLIIIGYGVSGSVVCTSTCNYR